MEVGSIGGPSPRWEPAAALSQEDRRQREAAMEQVSRMAAQYREELEREKGVAKAQRARRCRTMPVQALSGEIEGSGKNNDKRRTIASAETPASAPAKPKEGTVIFLDWDDTLLPTWFVTQVLRPIQSVDARGGGPLPAESPFYEALERHAGYVREVLTAARAIGEVAIITLACSPWVTTSAEWYLPGLDIDRLLSELDIPVYYAFEHVSQRKLRLAEAQVEEGVNPYVVCKSHAMSRFLRRGRRGRGGAARVSNVISVGDSPAERDAVKEVLWAHPAASAGPAALPPPLCKTVKLMDEPSLECLGAELQLLAGWLRCLAEHGDDFDFCMNDADDLASSAQFFRSLTTSGARSA